MSPLKITFRIRGGLVSPPYPMHLDALLAYAITQVSLNPDDPEAPASVAALREIATRLPLARHDEAGQWVWKASALMPIGTIRHETRFFTQRLDKKLFATHIGAGRVTQGRFRPDPTVAPGLDMKPYQGAIDTLRGAHRNLLGYYPVLDVEELECWCVGDRDEIQDYLVDRGLVTHLGARRRDGHGEITNVSIVPDQAAMDLWKIRVRPWAMLDDDAPIQAAWQAPYWAAENKGSAYCPTCLI